MYSEFIIFTKDLATSKEVPDNIIECIMSLGIDWKQNHIHKNIINYSTRIEHDIECSFCCRTRRSSEYPGILPASWNGMERYKIQAVQ